MPGPVETEVSQKHVENHGCHSSRQWTGGSGRLWSGCPEPGIFRDDFKSQALRLPHPNMPKNSRAELSGPPQTCVPLSGFWVCATANPALAFDK